MSSDRVIKVCGYIYDIMIKCTQFSFLNFAVVSYASRIKFPLRTQYSITILFLFICVLHNRYLFMTVLHLHALLYLSDLDTYYLQLQECIL